MDALFVSLGISGGEGDWDKWFEVFHKLEKQCTADGVFDSVARKAGLEFVKVIFGNLELGFLGVTVGVQVGVCDTDHRRVKTDGLVVGTSSMFG